MSYSVSFVAVCKLVFCVMLVSFSVIDSGMQFTFLNNVSVMYHYFSRIAMIALVHACMKSNQNFYVTPYVQNMATGQYRPVTILVILLLLLVLCAMGMGTIGTQE